MIRIERVGAVFTAILLLCSILSKLSRCAFVPFETGAQRYSLGCVACHVSSGGGDLETHLACRLKRIFSRRRVFRELSCGDQNWPQLDADGDGATNGEELGDPDGTWQQGDANPEGEIFFPWDAESTPPPPPPPAPTAVETTGWGQIKLLLDSE